MVTRSARMKKNGSFLKINSRFVTGLDLKKNALSRSNNRDHFTRSNEYSGTIQFSKILTGLLGHPVQK